MSEQDAPSLTPAGAQLAALRVLNERWGNFAFLVGTLGQSYTEAYPNAGYNRTAKPSTISKEASKLAARPEVAAVITALKAERDAALTDDTSSGLDTMADVARMEKVRREWVLARLVENVERAMQAEPVRDNQGHPTGEYRYEGPVANRSLELLGKELGMFKERQELTGANGAPLTLEVTVTRRVIRVGEAP